MALCGWDCGGLVSRSWLCRDSARKPLAACSSRKRGQDDDGGWVVASIPQRGGVFHPLPGYYWYRLQQTPQSVDQGSEWTARIDWWMRRSSAADRLLGPLVLNSPSALASQTEALRRQPPACSRRHSARRRAADVGRPPRGGGKTQTTTGPATAGGESTTTITCALICRLRRPEIQRRGLTRTASRTQRPPHLTNAFLPPAQARGGSTRSACGCCQSSSPWRDLCWRRGTPSILPLIVPVAVAAARWRGSHTHHAEATMSEIDSLFAMMDGGDVDAGT